MPLEGAKNYCRTMSALETLRTYNGKLFRLDDHLDRLYKSAWVMRNTPRWGRKEVEQRINKRMGKGGRADLKVRVILSARSLTITVEPLIEKPKRMATHGVALISYEGERTLPLAKIQGERICAVAKRAAESAGVYEAVLVDRGGYITECAYANIFWVNGGKVYTTNKNILLGITRKTVVELAGGCRYAQITIQQLKKVDEVFITQTTSGILPVVRLDGVRIGSGRPGPVTKRLMKAFHQLVSEVK